MTDGLAAFKLDEIRSGQRHEFDFAIGSAEMESFAALSGDRNPLHCDAAYGAKTEFGRCLVNSGLTIAIVLGMSVADVSAKAIANLGVDKLRLTAPVFPGDTIYAESEVIGKRESRTRATQGIVTVRTTGRKVDGTVFMTFERSALIPKRGHGVEDRMDR